MSMTDPIADFLTRIRNGLHADRDDVEMPASNFKAEIARILQEQGYIEGYEVEAARVGRVLRVTLSTRRTASRSSRDSSAYRSRAAASTSRQARSQRCRAAWARPSCRRRTES